MFKPRRGKREKQRDRDTQRDTETETETDRQTDREMHAYPTLTARGEQRQPSWWFLHTDSDQTQQQKDTFQSERGTLFYTVIYVAYQFASQRETLTAEMAETHPVPS